MSCNYAEGLSPYENKGKLGLPEKFDNSHEVEEKVEQLAEWIQKSKHIVLHTGAGISTSAGIPDFRGPKGVWTLEERGEKPDINVSWDDAQPTKTHMAIARLVELDIVKFVITQNIDGLHLRSGVSRTKLAELHGNMFVDQCDKCKKMIVRDSPSPTVGQKYTGAGCPASKDNGRKCRGKLRDFVLDWEDNLPDDDLTISDTHSMQADLSIVMGSTLQIIPAGNMPLYAQKYQNGRTVICNLQPTKHYAKADLNIHTYVDDIMEKLFNKLGLTIPLYQPNQDPVRKVRLGDLPAEGYIDFTQCSDLARNLKKIGDDIHEQYLKVRREEKKRKSLDPTLQKPKMIKREDLFKTLDKKPKILLPEKNAKNGSLNFKKDKRVVQNFRSKECIEVIDIDDVKYESVDKCKTEIKDDIKVDYATSDYEDDSDIEVISEVKSVSEVRKVEDSECFKNFTPVKEKFDNASNDDIEIIIDDPCEKDENVETSNNHSDRFRIDESIDCNNDDTNTNDSDDSLQDDDVEVIKETRGEHPNGCVNDAPSLDTASKILPIQLDSLQT